MDTQDAADRQEPLAIDEEAKKKIGFLRLNCLLIPRISTTFQTWFRKTWEAHKSKKWQDTCQDGEDFLAKIPKDLKTELNPKQREMISTGKVSLWSYDILYPILIKYSFGQHNLDKKKKNKLRNLNEARTTVKECKNHIISEPDFEKLWKTISDALEMLGDSPTDLQNLKVTNIGDALDTARKLSRSGSSSIPDVEFEKWRQLLKEKKYHELIECCTDCLKIPKLTNIEVSLIYTTRSNAYLHLALADITHSVELNPAWPEAQFRYADICNIFERYEEGKLVFEMAETMEKFINFEQDRTIEVDNIMANTLATELEKIALASKEQPPTKEKEDKEDKSVKPSSKKEKKEKEDKSVTPSGKEKLNAPEEEEEELGAVGGVEEEVDVVVSMIKPGRFVYSPDTYDFHIQYLEPYVKARCTYAQELKIAVTHFVTAITLIQELKVLAEKFAEELAMSLRCSLIVQDFNYKEDNLVASSLIKGLYNTVCQKNTVDEQVDRHVRICYTFLAGSKETIGMVEESMIKYPDEPIFPTILSRIHMDKKNYGYAIEVAEEALKSFPNNVELLYQVWLSLRAWNNGDMERLLTAAEKFVEKCAVEDHRVAESYYVMAFELLNITGKPNAKDINRACTYVCKGEVAEKKMLNCFIMRMTFEKDEVKSVMRRKPFMETYRKLKKTFKS